MPFFFFFLFTREKNERKRKREEEEKDAALDSMGMEAKKLRLEVKKMKDTIKSPKDIQAMFATASRNNNIGQFQIAQAAFTKNKKN